MQGVIFSIPDHDILGKCIFDILKTYKKARFHYPLITEQMYDNISKYTKLKELKHGKNKDVFLFQEMCSTSDELCYDGTDRHGVCCHHSLSADFDTNNFVIKTRYADYPW